MLQPLGAMAIQILFYFVLLFSPPCVLSTVKTLCYLQPFLEIMNLPQRDNVTQDPSRQDIMTLDALLHDIVTPEAPLQDRTYVHWSFSSSAKCVLHLPLNCELLSCTQRSL